MVQMIKMVHDGMMVINGPKWFKLVQNDLLVIEILKKI